MVDPPTQVVQDHGNRGSVADHRAKQLTKGSPPLTELEMARIVTERNLGEIGAKLRDRRQKGLAVSVADVMEAVDAATEQVREFKNYFRDRQALAETMRRQDSMVSVYNKKQLFDNWIHTLEASSIMFERVEVLLGTMQKPPEPEIVCPHDGKSFSTTEYEEHLRWHRRLLDEEIGI